MEAGTATIKVEADMTEAEEALRAFKAELLDIEVVVDRLTEKLASLGRTTPGRSDAA